MLNNVTLMGRLVRDPDMKTTQNGSTVTTFTIAVDRDFGKVADFINIVTWRKTAEFAGKFFRKGNLVAVAGSLQIREYTDKSGNKRTAAEVVADHCYFGQSKADRDEDDYADAESGNKQFQSTGSYVPVEDDDEGDLPF